MTERELGVALDAARLAGDSLVRASQRLAGQPPEFKGRRTELVTEADRDAERIVVEHLQREFPEHAILAEEGVLTPEGRASKDAEHLWIVDPLDGTTNFVHGLPFFAVALCLLEQGDPVLAVVHAPILQWTFTARAGHGAFRSISGGSASGSNDESLHVSATTDLGHALLATGFSYNRSEVGRDDNVARLGRALHESRDLRRYGSAALDLCMTAAGQFDGFWEMYLQPYDVAAGALIVREAGGRVTDLAGGDEWLYGGQIAASNGAVHDALLVAIGGTPS